MKGLGICRLATDTSRSSPRPSCQPPRLLGPFLCRSRLDPDRLSHLAPGQILLTLKPAQVDAGDRERTVVQELAHRLDRLTGIASQLCRGMAEDVDAGRRHTSALQVSAEPSVERPAGDALRLSSGLPERLGWSHRR